MRLVLSAAVLAGTLAVMAGTATAPASPCDAATNGKYVKPSSLAPGERAYKNEYGAPIAKPILARHGPHRKPKAQPQLRSSPLPGT
jgi:hypothetical protein